jgi:branched-chain amino acid transport system substrate-binding protein
MLSSNSRPRRSAGRRVTAALVPLVLLVAACGNDDDAGVVADDAATSEDSAADGDEGATGEPVTVVAILEETGPTPLAVGGVVQATADAINRNGGLSGHPIEVQIIDTRGDVATAQAAVRDIDDPVAVVLSSPSVEASIGDDLAALGVPVVGVGYAPGLWGGRVNAFGLSCESSDDFCALPNFFTVTTSFDAVVAKQLLAAQAAGATTVSSASCAEVDSCARAVPVFEAIADEVGLERSPGVRINSNAADYSSECVGFMQAGVDFIQISASESAGVRLIESCLDQGYEGTFGASAGSVTAALLEAPGALAGGLNGFPWFVDEEPVVEYRETMEEAGLAEAEYGSPTATGVYSAMLLLQSAINDHAEAEAPLDGTAALAALHQVQDEDLGGLIAPVSFSEDDLDRTASCFWLYTKDTDGNLENPLGGLTFQCYPEQ